MNHTKLGINEEAVSPVLGVLLMVAITIILAAVVGMFVLGMVPNMSKVNKVVAISAQQPESGKITITYLGGQDSSSFDYGKIVIVPDSGIVTYYHAAEKYSNGTTIATVTSPGTANDGIIGSEVGSMVTAVGTFSGRNNVKVIGIFTDSSQQVLIDTYV
jgi:archaeal type IV pilus assembly protein PilA